jgi:hypothetical protein
LALCLAAVTALGGVGCGENQPTGPSAASATALSRTAGSPSGAHASNGRPTLEWRTTPAADMKAVPYPKVSGLIPLKVRFNLCRSGDPDMVILPDGTPDPRFDSINWQFHFGDTNLPAFAPDGTFKPDFDHFCRVDHTYEREGTYTATLSVTDKHREDDLSANARQTIRITINAFAVNPDPAPQGAGPEILTFNDTGSCGDNHDLHWTTVNATSATLNGNPVPVNGTLENADQGTTYTLVVTGPGGTATQQLTTGTCS